MKEKEKPVAALAELPPATQEFLARLRPEDIETLEEGVRLVNAFRAVGRLMRWIILTAGGIFIGAVLLWESIERIFARLKSG